MKQLLFKIVLLLIVFAAAASVMADTDDTRIDMQGQFGQGQQSRRDFQLQNGMITKNGNPVQNDSVSDDTLLYLLENKQDTEEQTSENPDMPSQKDEQQDQTKNERKKRTKKTQLLLKAEPGDGLAKLTWRLINLPVRTDDKLIRFSIRYGIESQKPLKSIQVGVGDGYVLRGLRNNQPYYIQVLAVDRENLTLFKSEEIKVIPLAADEQGSLLEKTFSKKSITLQDKSEPEAFKRELHQFGYEFFKNSSQLLTAVDSLPVGKDYILGPGDTLNLNLWGEVNARYELTVDRNGQVTIPKVGAVKVWGLSYEQAKDSINRAILRYFRNFDMGLTLGALRTINVFVVGAVETPGGYPVSSLATVINALSAAGGPTRNGSLRTIRVTRAGHPPVQVDLYDFFLSGDRSKDVRLENGDTIYVPVIGPVVAVAGEVRRPAIYELKGETTIPEMLKMAGGVTATGYTGRIQVERAENNTAKIVLDFEPGKVPLETALAKVTLRDRDMLKVFPIQEAVRQVVTLKGNVVRPGEYQYRSGMRLTDLIPNTQALLPESYLDSVEIIRLSPPDYRRELLTANLRRALAGNESDNILLQEQDSVKVFARSEMSEKQMVYVNGAVVNSGPYDYYPGMSVRDLITAGGSPKRNAFLETGELSRVTIAGDRATTVRIPLNLSKAMAGDPNNNIPLQPDDVLMVRSVSNWSDVSDRLIKLEGEVRFPGVYSVAPDEKLSSLIERAGGYTEKAYLRGAKFTRRSVREAQQKRMDEFITKTEKEISTKQAAIATSGSSADAVQSAKLALEGLSRNLDRMRGLKAEGRVVIKLTPVEQLRKSDSDLVLEGGDALTIPQRPGVVNVMGEVHNPLAFVYAPESSRVDTYLRKAGGPTQDAEVDDMYIVRVDGTVFSRTQSSFGIHWSEESRRWTFGSFEAAWLGPGDTLVVPQILDKGAWMREFKDITTIMSQIALTAGVVVAAGL